MTIIFVPSNATQVVMFSSIYNSLVLKMRKNVLAICIDKYKQENSKQELIRAKIPFKFIEDYGSNNLFTLLGKEKPTLIILGNDFAPIEKSFVIASNCLGIPTLLIQDGLIVQASVSSKAPFRIIRHTKELLKWLKTYHFLIKTSIGSSEKAIPLITKDFLRRTVFTHNYGSSQCTNIAVAGEYVKNALIRKGIPKERIRVTGQPRFDELYERKFDNNFRQRIGCPPTTKLLTLYTQPFVEYKFWTEQQRVLFLVSVIKGIKQLSDVKLVIKLHPIEKVDYYKSILSRLGFNGILILKEVDLYDSINASDLLLTVSSTVALEGMILDKPIAIVNLFNETGSLPYVRSGAAAVISSPQEVASKISEILFDGEFKKRTERNRARFVSEHAYRIDGKSSERAANLVIEIIREFSIRSKLVDKI